METDPLVIVLSESARETRFPAAASKSRSATFSEPVNATVFGVPSEKRPVVPTFEAEVPLGGMKRSGPTAEPAGAETSIRPPRVAGGTFILISLGELEVTSGLDWLSDTTFERAGTSKFEPEIATSSPAIAIDGEIEEILGTEDSETVKLPLVTGPSSGVETATAPEVAPAGTLTVRVVAVAALTEVAVPLNLTVFDPGVVEKPVPSIVTVAPTSPR